MLTTARAFSVIGALALGLVWTDSFAQTAIHTQSTNPDAFFWNQPDGTITGDVHSNGGIEILGRRNTVVGNVTYVTSLVDTYAGTADATSFSIPPAAGATQAWPLTTTVADFAPGGQYAIEAGNEYFDVSSSCVNNWVAVDLRGASPQQGTYYATCRMKVYMDATTGKYTFASTGRIQFVAVNNSNFEAHTGLTAAIATSPGSQAISLDGPGTIIDGRLIAPNGRVRIVGSWHQLMCGIYGDRVLVSARKITIDANCPLLSNQAPVANADLVEAVTATSIDIDVLANDTDADGSIDETSVAVVNNGNGTTQVLPSGQIRFTSAAGFVGTTIFTYTVADDEGAVSNVAEVRVEVGSPNQPPVASPDLLTVTEDGEATINVLANDFDGESALDLESFLVVDAPDNGLLFLEEPMGTVRYVPDENFSGTDQFFYTIADDEGLASTPVVVDITVAAVNDAPVLSPVTIPVVEDTPITFTVPVTDPDSTNFTYQIVGGTQTGSISGAWGSLQYTPAADFVGIDTFDLTVNDGSTTSAPATVTFDIDARNDVPSATVAPVSVAEDQSVTIPVTIVDPDSSAFTLSVTTQPPNGGITVSGETLTYPPMANFFGTDTFVFVVNDGMASSDPVSVPVQGTPVNDPPMAMDGMYDVTIGQSTSIEFMVSDIDSSSLTINLVSGPSEGTLSGSGLNRTYTPDATFPGSDTIRFTVTDGQATSAEATIMLSGSAANGSPTITSTEVTTVAGGATYTYDVDATDPDGDTLTYSLTDSPSGMTINATTGLIEWVNTMTGTYMVSVRVEDPQGAFDVQAFQLDVTANAAPEFTQLPLLRAPIGQTYRSQLRVVDADGDLVTVSLSQSPTGMTLTELATNHFELTWISTGSVGDTIPVSLVATDVQGASTGVTVDLLITASGDGASTLGTDFWLTHIANSEYSFGIAREPVVSDLRVLQLTIAAPEGATGSADIASLNNTPSAAFSQNFTIPAGQSVPIDLPDAAVNQGEVSGRGSPAIHVTSDSPVSVVGYNWRQYSSDSWLAIPTPSLGTSYQLAGYERVGRGYEIDFGVIAVESGTTDFTYVGEAGWTPRDSGDENPQTSATMPEQGWVDLEFLISQSGAQLDSTRPVAVVSGSRCANVPFDFGTCDHLIEQMLPTFALASEYVAAPIATRPRGSLYRVIATVDNTLVTIYGQQYAPFDDGEVIDQVVTGPVHIVASQPVVALQYTVGSRFDADLQPAERQGFEYGDPFMVQLPPVDNILSDYVFTVLDGDIYPPLAPPRIQSGITAHYLGVTIRMTDAASLVLNGTPVDTSAFLPVGDTGFVAGTIEVVPGSYRLSANGAFGLTSYGFGEAESYGHNVGLSFPTDQMNLTVSVTPSAQSHEVGGQACIDMTMTDSTGARAARARYDISGIGSTDTSFVGFSNDVGQAQYCYSESLAGLDSLTISVNGDQQTATVDWLGASPGNNLPPVFTSTPVYELYEPSLIYNVSVVDPNSDNVTVEILNGPDGMAFDAIASQLTWTPSIPADREPTTHRIELRASDPGGASSTQTWLLTVYYPIESDPVASVDSASDRVGATIEVRGGNPDLLDARILSAPPGGAQLFWRAIMEIATESGAWEYLVFLAGADRRQTFAGRNRACYAPGAAIGTFQMQQIRDISVNGLLGNAVGPVVDTNDDGFVDAADDIYSLTIGTREITLYNLTTSTAAWVADALAMSTTHAPAIANLDNDAEMELLVAGVRTGDPGTVLTAFDTDGSVLWSSTEVLTNDFQGQMPAPILVDDLTGDGTPEIVVGRRVLNNVGQLLWAFDANTTGGTYGRTNLAIPVIADLDADGSKEIVFSNEVRRADGSLYWDLSSLGLTDAHGVYGIGDLDGEGSVEVVGVVGEGREESGLDQSVYAWRGDGTLLWGPVAVRAQSVPVVADVDTDGELEIYLVDNQTRISATGVIEHLGSGSDLSSDSFRRLPIVDLNRDGLYERLRFGSRDELLIEEIFGGGAWGQINTDIGSFFDELSQNIAVADVDHDGGLDIVIAGSFATEVFTSASTPWSGSAAGRTQLVDYSQTALGVDVLAAPLTADAQADLWVGNITVSEVDANTLALTATVTNRGNAPVTQTMTLDFLQGGVDAGVLLGQETVPSLGIGESAQVTTVVARTSVDGVIGVSLDLPPGLTQCVTDNAATESV